MWWKLQPLKFFFKEICQIYLHLAWNIACQSTVKNVLTKRNFEAISRRFNWTGNLYSRQVDLTCAAQNSIYTDTYALGLHRCSSCSGWSWQHWSTSVLHLPTWIIWSIALCYHGFWLSCCNGCVWDKVEAKYDCKPPIKFLSFVGKENWGSQYMYSICMFDNRQELFLLPQQLLASGLFSMD